MLDRGEAREKAEVLRILQQKRLLDAWRLQAAESQREDPFALPRDLEAACLALASQFHKVRPAHQLKKLGPVLRAWRLQRPEPAISAPKKIYTYYR